MSMSGDRINVGRRRLERRWDGGGDWSLQGLDPCVAGTGEADTEAEVAGARIPGRIHGICGPRQKGDGEVRKRRRKKGGAVLRPRQELTGVGRKRETEGSGVAARIPCR